MKALADYVHAKGLKLGIYSDMGYKTCGGYPGSKFYIEQDAQTFAAWGIDSLKLDGCNSAIDDFPIGYPIMGAELNKTGRPILYSCSWPAYFTGQKLIPQYKDIAKNCNLWRNYIDIDDSFDTVTKIIQWFAQDQGNFTGVAGPGNWNDPDMLVIGDYGLSHDEERVQMAIWAIMAAPLYMSNDLRNIRPESRALLLNKRVIAINQDPLGIQGIRLFKDQNVEFWRRQIMPVGSYAIALVNYGTAGGPTRMEVTLSNFGLDSPNGYNVTDAFDGTSVHAKGLKLGIYSDMGSETCGGYPGSKFYMERDAQTFAAWGIDSLKLDGCYSTIDDFPIGYPIMGLELNKTGRPILYSCSWPAYYTGKKLIPPYKDIAQNCNLWRNYDDIDDSFDSVTNIIQWFAQDKGNFTKVAGPGNWNDPDMLIIGDYGLSNDEERVQMAIWAIMAAPLYMSNDLRNIRPESRALLLNKRVIAINQDPLGIQGIRLFKDGNLEFWQRQIAPVGSYAIALVNYGSGGGPARLEVSLSNFAINGSGSYNVTEAFDGTSIGVLKPNDKFDVRVNPSGVFLAIAVKM
nr:hypothetical protein BaRGS_016787 [Batillaria attramentaria]